MNCAMNFPFSHTRHAGFTPPNCQKGLHRTQPQTSSNGAPAPTSTGRRIPIYRTSCHYHHRSDPSSWSLTTGNLPRSVGRRLVPSHLGADDVEAHRPNRKNIFSPQLQQQLIQTPMPRSPFTLRLPASLHEYKASDEYSMWCDETACVTVEDETSCRQPRNAWRFGPPNLLQVRLTSCCCVPR